MPRSEDEQPRWTWVTFTMLPLFHSHLTDTLQSCAEDTKRMLQSHRNQNNHVSGVWCMCLVCDGFGLVYLQQGGLTGGIGRKRQGVGMRIVEVFRTLLSMRLGVLGWEETSTKWKHTIGSREKWRGCDSLIRASAVHPVFALWRWAVGSDCKWSVYCRLAGYWQSLVRDTLGQWVYDHVRIHHSTTRYTVEMSIFFIFDKGMFLAWYETMFSWDLCTFMNFWLWFQDIFTNFTYTGCTWAMVSSHTYGSDGAQTGLPQEYEERSRPKLVYVIWRCSKCWE